MVNESYSMNRSPVGGPDSYYECSLGESFTPTVVSNFNLPNRNVNKDGPYLQIFEQPQTKFRFRYKSEMVGTHGQLKAETSDKNRNVYPTVKLCNWTSGPALIRLMLYTAEDNANERKRHVHELNGKNCNKEGFTGGCEVVVDDQNSYTAQFPNLGIIHIAKRDVQNIIYQRKKEELINLARVNNPGLRNESIQHNISPTDLQKLKEAAEEEARNMDLNKVVLRFQAYFFDNKDSCYRPITEYVDSDVIFNLKNASTGELKIVRLSAVSSPCTGGTEVWMLVEKVKKSNVRIKFYELGRDGSEVWKGYGEFKESDVHHQYAIVFRTPPYRSTSITEPANVKLQLERTTDNDTSEPLDFTFTPDTLKRSNAYLDTQMDSEVHPQKRFRHSVNEPIDLKMKTNLFLGSREIKQPYSPEAPYQSPPHMVPSPVAPADSPSSQGFYSPIHQGSARNPSITVSTIDDEQLNMYLANQKDIGMTYGHNPHEQQTGHHEFRESPQFQYAYGGGYQPNGYVTSPVDGGNISPTFQNRQDPSQVMALSTSPYHEVPSPLYNQQNSPYSGHSPSPGEAISPVFCELSTAHHETALEQIKQFDAVQEQVIYNKTHSPHQLDFSDLVNSPNEINQNDDMDLLDIISNSRFFSAPKDFGDIQADCARPRTKGISKQENSSTKEMDTLAEKLSSVSVAEKSSEKQAEESSAQSESGNKDQKPKDIAFRAAMTAADCLRTFSSTGDVNVLLDAHRHLLALHNKYGNNSLHTAIGNRDTQSFKKILRASLELKCYNILRAQNFAGETPLHLAVRRNEKEMVKELLETQGTDLAISDFEGNTALHLAALLPEHHCISAILTQQENGMVHPAKNVIDIYNYHGQTPLHLAVIAGRIESAALLIESGALVHLCEKKQGANPLHLAVMFGHHSIAKYLINKTNVTVDAGLLNGNTALHIAVQAKDKEMCSIIMAGKANPYAKNNIRKTQKKRESQSTRKDESDESSSDEDDGDYFTPIDYSKDDEEILAILKRTDGDVLVSNVESPV